MDGCGALWYEFGIWKGKYFVILYKDDSASFVLHGLVDLLGHHAKKKHGWYLDFGACARRC